MFNINVMNVVIHIIITINRLLNHVLGFIFILLEEMILIEIVNGFYGRNESEVMKYSIL